MSWGKRIAAAREAHGLTQEEFAKRLNASQSTVAKWETEEREPKLVKFIAIAELTRTTPEWLAFGVGAGPPGQH